MSTLNDIIDSSANLEVKRALAVKMITSNFKTEEICCLLNVSASFVSKWKMIYEDQGVEALCVNYKGGTGFLTPLQRDESFCHLKDKPHYSVEELQDYIKRRYNVVYQSKQSYYDILKDAGLSWHRTQATNPKQNEEAVLLKREEIKKLDARQSDIVSGQLIVFSEDESHLLWGDTQGYVWGRCNERTEIPIQNVAMRQTYYGALNLLTQEFTIIPAETGNGVNSVLFIKHLQALHPYNGPRISDRKIGWYSAT